MRAHCTGSTSELKTKERRGVLWGQGYVGGSGFRWSTRDDEEERSKAALRRGGGRGDTSATKH